MVGAQVRAAEVPEVIDAYLAAKGLAFHREGEAGFVIGFGEGSDVALSVLVTFSADGGLVVEASSPQVVASDDVVGALWSLNAWNAATRVPKGRLVAVSGTDPGEGARVVLEGWLPLVEEVPAGQVERFLEAAIGGACVFWGRAAEVT